MAARPLSAWEAGATLRLVGSALSALVSLGPDRAVHGADAPAVAEECVRLAEALVRLAGRAES